MKPKVAIFGKPRTGTGSMGAFFCELGMDLVHEPFHPSKWPQPYDIVHELERIYAAYDGMKHLHAHVKREMNLRLLNFLRERRIPIIYMRRRNEFWAALSEQLATQTGFWGCEPERLEPYHRKVAETLLDIGRLRWLIGFHEQENAVYDAQLTGPDILLVEYDDFYNVTPARQHDLLEQAFRLIGLTAPPDWQTIAERFFAPRHKQTTAEVYTLLPNRVEVEAAFGVSLAGSAAKAVSVK